MDQWYAFPRTSHLTTQIRNKHWFGSLCQSNFNFLSGPLYRFLRHCTNAFRGCDPNLPEPAPVPTLGSPNWTACEFDHLYLNSRLWYYGTKEGWVASTAWLHSPWAYTGRATSGDQGQNHSDRNSSIFTCAATQTEQTRKSTRVKSSQQLNFNDSSHVNPVVQIHSI